MLDEDKVAGGARGESKSDPPAPPTDLQLDTSPDDESIQVNTGPAEHQQQQHHAMRPSPVRAKSMQEWKTNGSPIQSGPEPDVIEQTDLYEKAIREAEEMAAHVTIEPGPRVFDNSRTPPSGSSHTMVDGPPEMRPELYPYPYPPEDHWSQPTPPSPFHTPIYSQASSPAFSAIRSADGYRTTSPYEPSTRPPQYAYHTSTYNPSYILPPPPPDLYLQHPSYPSHIPPHGASPVASPVLGPVSSPPPPPQGYYLSPASPVPDPSNPSYYYGMHHPPNSPMPPSFVQMHPGYPPHPSGRSYPQDPRYRNAPPPSLPPPPMPFAQDYNGAVHPASYPSEDPHRPRQPPSAMGPSPGPPVGYSSYPQYPPPPGAYPPRYGYIPFMGEPGSHSSRHHPPSSLRPVYVDQPRPPSTQPGRIPQRREPAVPDRVSSPYRTPLSPHGVISPSQSSSKAFPSPSRSTFSPASSQPQQQQAQSPSSHPLARGHLAQARLREAIFEAPSGLPGDQADRKGSVRASLPRPPPHSEYAMWIGNVGADVSHQELWRFFANQPPPDPTSSDPDLRTSGVDSIHLISRSNCAFVNYRSQAHLDHALKCTQNQSLRPHDPRCKELVCRVRKLADSTLSGVGAQRSGARIHHQWVAQQKERQNQGKPLPMNGDSQSDHPTNVPAPHHESSDSTTHSGSTTSTTSSFLSRHFSKRYFILKSHTESDLRLSVERGIWATQTHNEPVLDQAFRSAKDGVFLIYSVNKAGAWWGYAKMTSPILTDKQRPSWTSRDDQSNKNAPNEQGSENPDSLELPPPRMFSPSERRMASSSPMPMTPGVQEAEPHSASEPKFTDPGLMETAEMAGNYRRGESLDPHMLADSYAAGQQLVLGPSASEPTRDLDGVWRKDTILSPEERNARLEQLEGEDVAPPEIRTERGWGRPFTVEWIKVERLPFHRTRHLRNPFNGNREVKISRDGTEVEPSVGQALCDSWS